MPGLTPALQTSEAAPGPSYGLCFLTATWKSPEKHQTREETPTSTSLPAAPIPPCPSSEQRTPPRPAIPLHQPNPPTEIAEVPAGRGAGAGDGGCSGAAGAGGAPGASPGALPAAVPPLGGVPGGGSRPGSGGAGAAPGAAPAPGPPPALRSIPGWAGRADSRARRPPRAHRPGSARRRRRRSCPAPTCGGGCPGRVAGELPPPAAPLALSLPACPPG